MQEEKVGQIGARAIMGLVGFAVLGTILAAYAGLTLGLMLAVFKACWGVFT